MREFLERILGNGADCFQLDVKDGGRGYYRVTAKNGRVTVTADSKTNAAAGLYRYLKDYLKINYSWCGNRELKVDTSVLPDCELYAEVRQRYISMFNYCTYGYSMTFWDWPRWERELDFMAMNGINLPLFVVGLEAVWYKTLLKNGFTRDEALAFISSPSHFPWQIMTNIEGVMPAMSEELINQRAELGKKIIDRMLELGMTPIQMGFSGFVPRLFKEKYFKNADIKKKIDWCGVEGTCELNPKDPLFKKLGLDFLEAQRELFGAYHYYACDPFHESEPPVKGKKYLKEVSRAIQDMYSEFDPQYRWVMQSWSIRKHIAKAVPRHRLLVLDLAGKNHIKTCHFWGHDYLTGNLHNFGGRINLHGDIRMLAENQFAKKRFHKNAVGTGLFMEGINQNPLYYDLAFKMLTEPKKCSLDDYLRDYALRRYGADSADLRAAVRILADTAYSAGTNDVENSSMICARPALNVKKSGPNNGFKIPYDPAELVKSLGLYLGVHRDGLKDGYYFDIYDIARQAASNELQALSKKIRAAYESRERAEFDKYTGDFIEYLTLTDKLLLTRSEFNLYEVLNSANTYTPDAAVNARLVCAQRTLQTVWADIETPDIFDYAWREWGGMIGEFYLVRWKMFFDYLSEEFNKPDRYDTEKEKKLPQCYGRERFFANNFYTKMGNFEIEWTKKAYENREITENNVETYQAALQIYNKLTGK